MSALCLTLAETDLEVLQRKLHQYSGQVDFIEVRLDFLEKPGIPRVAQATGSRFIATCRPVREGGKYSAGEPERIDLLCAAADQGFDWIDLEHDVPVAPRGLTTTQLIRSLHRFDGCPKDLSRLHRKLCSLPGDAVKVAVQVRGSLEQVRLLEFMENLPGDKPRVVLGMGIDGQITRVLAGQLGNLWTYVVEDESGAVAPGQFSLALARRLFDPGKRTTRPAVFGLLEEKPDWETALLLNQLFRRHGLDSLCLPIPVDDVAVWFNYVKRSTIPYRGFLVNPSMGEIPSGVLAPGAPIRIDYLSRTSASQWMGLAFRAESDADRVAEVFETWTGIKPASSPPRPTHPHGDFCLEAHKLFPFQDFSPFRIRVPGSTSNLGSGFDTVSAALSIYLEVEVAPAPGGGLEWPEDWTVPTSENAIEIGLRRTLEALGRPLPGLRFNVRSDIPLKRGLGSSGAAYVAGVKIAERLCGATLPPDEALNLVFPLEGHPENLAASLLGGWAISWVSQGRMTARRLPNRLGCKYVVAIPETKVSTDDARAILPRTLSLSDAVFNLQRCALLVFSVMEGWRDGLAEGTQDRLHQEFRARLVPGATNVLARQSLPDGLSRSLCSLTVSGSGSTLLGIATDHCEAIGQWMVDQLAEEGTPACFRVLELDEQGPLFI